MLENFKKNERIGIHSHILGLENLNDKNGFIQIEDIKNALSLVKKILKLNKSGQMVILSGPSESGKTAFLNALKLDCKDYFVNDLDSSEISTSLMSKTELITQLLRKSIKLNIKENIKVIEGEVTSLNLSKIGLKTLDMESTFEIGENMLKQIEKEKIVTGDVIRIIKERGKIIKLGISSSKIEPDLLGDLIPVSCPEGEMFKEVEEIQKISLHEVDALNNKTHGYLGIYNGETGEINYDVRKEVNEKIKQWILEGKVEVERGILILENVHMLDKICISFLNRSAESSFFPIVIMTTNKNDTELINLFNNAIKISTASLNKEKVEKILRNRIVTENIKISEEALIFLLNLSENTGPTYVLNILSLCKVQRLKNDTNISENDVKNVVGLFLDSKRAYENY